MRPEDIQYLEEYVDVCEFYGDYKKFDILYDIYKNDEKWFGNLQEIIIGLDKPIDSKYIVPRYGQKRIRCNRECLKGGKCKICFSIEELSKNLEKIGMVVQ